jgi:spore coat protein U-like protein
MWRPILLATTTITSILCHSTDGARAATETTTFQVQITIVAACEISSVNDLDFGSHGVLAANIDVSTTFDVQCTLDTPFNIGLDAGTGAGATVATRRMTGPASATIDYSLFTDAGRTTVWGDTPTVDTVDDTGTGSAETFTVFGRVPPQTTPAPGLYADTITITVTF